MLYISDEQLHAMEIFIYHCIQVQVEGLEDEHISPICRCTEARAGAEGTDRTTKCG